MVLLAALAVVLAALLLLLAPAAEPEDEVLAVDDGVLLVVVAELLAGVELPVDDEDDGDEPDPAAALLLGAALPNVDAVGAHDTMLGTLILLAWQICWAKSMAFCWSEASHCAIRQHEMEPMKLLSAQMQAGSRPQLPMPPLRKMSAHVVFFEREARRLVFWVRGGTEGVGRGPKVRGMEGKTYRAAGQALELGEGEAG